MSIRAWLNPWTLTLTALPITWLLALFSWNLVEKPFVSRQKRNQPEPANYIIVKESETQQAQEENLPSAAQSQSKD